MAYLFLFINIFVLVGCGIVPAYAPTRQFVPIADQTIEHANENKTRVYAIRPGISKSVFSVDVFDGESKIGELGPKGFLSWERDPGPLHLETVFETKSSFDDTTKPGENVFLLLGGGNTVFGDPSRVNRIELDDALNRFARVETSPSEREKKRWFKTDLVDTWYYSFSFTPVVTRRYGGALHQIEKDLQDRLSSPSNQEGASLVNIYWSLANSSTLLGLRIFDFDGATYEKYYQKAEFIHQTYIGFSAMQFYPGSGVRYFFIRADSGLTNIKYRDYVNRFQPNLNENGINGSVSLGFALPLYRNIKPIISYKVSASLFPSGRSYASGVFYELMW